MPNPIYATDHETGITRLLHVSDADRDTFDAHPRHSRHYVEVLDTITGETLALRWAACGLRCRCAAEYTAKALTGPNR